MEKTDRNLKKDDISIGVKKLQKNAMMPFRATDFSAGADLYACIREEAVIKKGSSKMIPTGISLEIPVGFAGFIYARSGLSCKHGVIPSNCTGVIDSDYRGEIKVYLTNLYDEPYVIKPGDRIAQIVIMALPSVKYEYKDELGLTKRSDGGFGSTGRS